MMPSINFNYQWTEYSVNYSLESGCQNEEFLPMWKHALQSFTVEYGEVYFLKKIFDILKLR